MVPLSYRLLRALAIAAIATACLAIWASIPRAGSITGVCIDAATGKPIAHAHVWVSFDGDATPDQTSSGLDNTEDDSDITDALGGTEAPYGWSQTSREDAPTDGVQMPSTYAGARADAQGRFTIDGLRAGAYELSADARGYNDSDENQLFIAADKTTRETVDMDAVGPSMEFSETEQCWLPDENVVLGLTGRLVDPHVTLTLEKVDLDGMLAHNPAFLVTGQPSDDPQETSPGWPGALTKVRSWPVELGMSEDSGDFYKRIDAGRLPAGFYRVTAVNPQETASGWIVVTRLGLIRKGYPGHTLAFVCDLETGRAKPGIPVTAVEVATSVSGSGVLARGVTSASGIAEVDPVTTDTESQGVLYARDGDSVAAVSLELNSPGSEQMDDGDNTQYGTNNRPAYSMGALRSFLYTERPIYRPGQTVYFKGIVRWFDLQAHARSANDLVVPNAEAVTVDIKDGQDNLVSHQVLTTNAMGSWNGSIALSTEALTGEYSIDAQVGGQSAETTFVVAAYQKPEFKVDIAFDKKRYVRGDTINATVTASYYFGGPVTAGTLQYTVTQDDGSDTGDDDGDNSNNDAADSSGLYNQPNQGPPQTSSGESAVTGSIRLDDHGQAYVRIPTTIDTSATGDVTYTLDANITDTSQRSVDQQASTVVGQGEFSLSLQTVPYCSVPGSAISVDVAATEANGHPLPNQHLRIVTAYSAWNDNTERLSDIHARDVVTGASGTYDTTAVAPRGGLFTISAKATDRRGNLIEADSTVWVSSEYGAEDVNVPYPDMAILLDKPKYNIGDTAHILINTKFVAQNESGPTAWVTVEGATLYQSITVPLTRKSTALDIPVTGKLSPGVTVSVCAISDKQYLSSTEHLTIDDKRRELGIRVDASPALLHPGDPVTLTLHTTGMDGKPTPAEVSVGVVDSSIYAVLEDPDDSIYDAMLPDQGDVVSTDYSCPVVYLGDVDKGAVGVKLRSNFKDTAEWDPDVRTDAGGVATVRFLVPDNLTTWRVTCIGDTLASEVGKTTTTFIVNKDLVARLETPPFLTSGDHSTFVGVVNNNTAQAFTATVNLDASGVTLGAVARQTVAVPANGSASVSWPVTAAAPCSGDLKMTAWTAANGPSDGVELPIPILPHAAHTDIWQAGSLLKSVDRTVTLDAGADPQTSVLHIRLSPSIASTLVPAWEYLLQYPYGSTDVTASALTGDAVLAENLPGLGLPNHHSQPGAMPTALGRHAASIAPSVPNAAAVDPRLADAIDRGVRRLARFQQDNGGWGWFETDKPDFWMTVYATWALVNARAAGYSVPKTVFQAAVNATAQAPAPAHGYPDDVPSEYAMAALVLARSGDLNAARDHLVSLWESWKAEPWYRTHADMAVAILAARAIGGDYAATAQKWTDQLWSERLRLGDLSAWQFSPHAQATGYAQDPPDTEATAWCLLAVETMNPNDPRIDGVARWLMDSRSDDHWECPVTTADVLQALGPYLAASHERTPNFDATVTVAGKPVKTLHFGPDSLDEPDVTIDVPAPLERTAEVRLSKSGQGRLYYSLDLRESLAVGQPPREIGVLERWYDRVWHPERLVQPDAPSGYRIKRVFLRDTSRRNFIWEDTVPTPGRAYRKNDCVIVRLIIDATRAGSHLIIEEPVPAGCTISEVSGDETDDWDNWWDYTDVRDDKIVFFVGDMTRGRHEIDYHLSAQAPGSYDVMPTSITAEFDPTLHALGSADHVTVD